MPMAPKRIADETARFIARRKATRRTICRPTFSATNCASISGLRISWISISTSCLVSFSSSFFNFDLRSSNPISSIIIIIGFLQAEYYGDDETYLDFIFNNEDFVFSFVGKHVPFKRPMLLVEAAALANS